MRITKTFRFEATNKLLHGYQESVLHGHNYKVSASVEGFVNRKTGMVLNPKDLERIFVRIKDFGGACILNVKDKQWVRYFRNKGMKLVVFSGEPTVENIARDILMEAFAVILERFPQIHKVIVSVWETEDFFATLTWERTLQQKGRFLWIK